MGAEFSSQGWNRYSYVGNNPLRYTDPSGLCFLGCFWKSIFHGIGSIFRAIARVPVVGQALAAVGGTALCDGNPQCGIAAVAALNSAEAGVTSGRLGDALKAGLITYAEAGAFNELNGVTGLNPTFGSTQYFERVAGSALVGCTAAAASGQNCGSAALAGAAGAAAGPAINGAFPDRNNPVDYTGGLVASAVVGGGVSVAGGGKFANGAGTAAFQYLMTSGPGGTSAANDNLSPLGNIPVIGQVLEGVQWAGNEIQTAVGWFNSQAQSVFGWDSNPAGNTALTNGSGSSTQGDLYRIPFKDAGRKSPILYCQNVECGAPTGGVVYPLCPQCNERLKNGGPPILLENGQKITVPIGDDDDE